MIMTSNGNLIRIKKSNYCNSSTFPWQEQHLCFSCFFLIVSPIFSASLEPLPHHLPSNSNNYDWKKIIWVTGVLRRTFVCEIRQPVRKLSSKSREDEFCTCCRNVSHKTTVLFRPSITQMIFFNQGMLLLGSNYVPNLNNYYDELIRMMMMMMMVMMTIMAERAMKPTMILTVGNDGSPLVWTWLCLVFTRAISLYSPQKFNLVSRRFMIIILIFNLPNSSELAGFLVFLVFALLLLGTDVAFLKCKATILLKDSHVDFHTIFFIQTRIIFLCKRNLKIVHCRTNRQFPLQKRRQ